MDKRDSQGKFAKGRKLKPENHPRWTGGLPKCRECNKQLTSRHPKLYLCKKCFLKRSKGNLALNWQGGKKNNNGYTMIYNPTHPNADQQGYVREHRLVMEKHLNRLLKVNEVIHHKNGMRSDNKIENLELTYIGKHEKLHDKFRQRDNLGRYL